MLAAAVVVAVGLLAAADRFIRPSAAEPEDKVKYDGKAFTVVHVADGDTVDIDCPDGRHAHTRIRLLGVDTPETVKPDTPVQYWGPQASQLAHDTLAGKIVTVRLDGARSRDKYGRLLAYLILPDGRNYSEFVITSGNGYSDYRFPHSLRSQFDKAQKAARAARVGLWANVTAADLPDHVREHLNLKPGQPVAPPPKQDRP
jgi:micrococcal nuclease